MFCPACAATPDAAGAMRQHLAMSPTSTAVSGTASTSDSARSHAAAMAAGLAAAPLGGQADAGPAYIRIYDVNGRPPLKTAAFDGNVKCTRYKSAGCSAGYANVPRTWTTFLGDAHTVVWDLADAGALPLSLPAAGAAAAAAGDAAAGVGGADDEDLELQVEEEHHCHPRLHCNRETSKYSSIVDECGLVGGVCSHGQPLVGGFLAMPAPERSLYYDAILSKLCSAAAIDIMYLDIGCAYKRHWDLYMSHAFGPTHIKVPWWHAMTQGASCFLKNSWMYHPGTGRRVGENCEQFWALIKPFTPIARYMAKPHYLDFVEDSIFRIACGRQARFVELMQDLDQGLCKKLGECRERKKQLQASAAAAGATAQQLMDAAVAALAPTTQAAAGSDADEKRLMVELVRAHQELKAVQHVRQESSAFAVALPGAQGSALQARSNDTKRNERLAMRIAT